jgi:hypothetical protein
MDRNRYRLAFEIRPRRYVAHFFVFAFAANCKKNGRTSSRSAAVKANLSLSC